MNVPELRLSNETDRRGVLNFVQCTGYNRALSIRMETQQSELPGKEILSRRVNITKSVNDSEKLDKTYVNLYRKLVPIRKRLAEHQGKGNVTFGLRSQLVAHRFKPWFHVKITIFQIFFKECFSVPL